MTAPPRDRLRDLLDAVLDPGHENLTEMARAVFASPFDFSRKLSRAVGEPPVAMRRRVLLERAAWQLGQGASVTDTAFGAGYDSVDGFSRAFARAFGRPPSGYRGGPGWLPAPNGVHFHPPTSLWVHTQEQPVNPVTDLMVQHDLADTRALLDAAAGIPEGEYHRVRAPGLTILGWDGPEESIAAVLAHHVHTKQVWLAAVHGQDLPAGPPHTLTGLIDLHEDVAGRWLDTVRDLDRHNAWADVLIDALCDPPESFVLGSVVTHVLTLAAHRRMLARQWLRTAGARLDDGDPITWLRREHGQDDRTHQEGTDR